MRPVVLVRDLFDVVVSIRDHVRNEDTKTSVFYVNTIHTEKQDDEFEYMIARMAIPWYLNFYRSWLDCPQAVKVCYEEICNDPVATVAKTCGELGIRISDLDAANAVTKAKSEFTRLNVGRPGRGNALSERTRSAILEMLRFYPECHRDAYFRLMRPIPEFQ